MAIRASPTQPISAIPFPLYMSTKPNLCVPRFKLSKRHFVPPKPLPILQQKFQKTQKLQIDAMESAAASTKGGRGKPRQAAKAVSRSQKAGLQFPVGRIARFLKKGRYSQRVGSGSPVYLSAVLEYLAAEVCPLSLPRSYFVLRIVRFLVLILIVCLFVCFRSGSGIGWKCSSGQQEDQNRSKAHSTGGEERRGVEQAFGIGDNSQRRRSAEHSPGFAAEENRQREGRVWICLSGVLGFIMC